MEGHGDGENYKKITISKGNYLTCHLILSLYRWNLFPHILYREFICQLLVTITKYLKQHILKKKGFILAHGSRGSFQD